MKHLIICREYPPSPGGGIGTYVSHISDILAESGETVHVIAQLWKGATRRIEVLKSGRLVVHRVPCEGGLPVFGPRPSPLLKRAEELALFNSGYHPQLFSWRAALKAEELIEAAAIDIVEAQEYEAPLYYLQARRALGRGPKKTPPCIVHIHSPSALIGKYNGWYELDPYFMTASALEDYTVKAADGLLCPSRFLARGAEAHFSLTPESVTVIPYPMGESIYIERTRQTWSEGTVCYIGRLEPRKGTVEWIDAAVQAARTRPGVRFEFVGANTLSTDTLCAVEFVQRRIPDELKRSFSFQGQRSRASLPRFLERARIGVVPSKWENFPYVCIEQMASGVPLIVSPNGGMVEMVEDGVSGWIARSCDREGLAEALERALATPPRVLEEMGRSASVRINTLTGHARILEEQLKFRRALIERGAGPSLHFPTPRAFGRGANEGPERGPGRAQAKPGRAKSMALIVSKVDRADRAGEGHNFIEAQTTPPSPVVLVRDEDIGEESAELLEKDPDNTHDNARLLISQKGGGGGAEAKNAAVREVLESGADPVGFVFVGEGERLDVRYIEKTLSVLERNPEVGLVSCWVRGPGKEVRAAPFASFPLQLFSNNAPSVSAVRTEALTAAGLFDTAFDNGYEFWDLFNSIIASGWTAVTIPEVLAECGRAPLVAQTEKTGAGAGAAMHKLILEKYWGRERAESFLTEREVPSRSLYKSVVSVPIIVSAARTVLRHPVVMARHVLGRLR